MHGRKKEGSTEISSKEEMWLERKQNIRQKEKHESAEGVKPLKFSQLNFARNK